MLERPVIVDTGPLVAFLPESEKAHSWVVERFRLLPAPVYTCEAVLAEACHLVRHAPGRVEQLLGFIGSGFFSIEFELLSQVEALSKLIGKYQDLPMSLADACLVRMAELKPSAVVFTLDSHFKIYRKHGRQVIETIMPPQRP